MQAASSSDALNPASPLAFDQQRSKGIRLLVDWDGCLAVSNRLHAPALPFLARNANRIAIVSNNSTDLPDDFSQILAQRGVAIPPERIVLAGAETLKIAAACRPKRLMVLGPRKMIAYALSLGLPVEHTDPDMIVLLRDTRLTYRRLERAANALLGGARLIVANPDATHPGESGRVLPETGAILAALMSCAGARPVKKEIVGKPGPYLFWRACEALGVGIENALMIGDNPATDIAGARDLGMDAILVDSRGGIGALPLDL